MSEQQEETILEESSYIDLTSEEGENPYKEDVERVANNLSLFLETEYQDAIFSDANYIPTQQAEEINRLEKEIEQMKKKQTELAFQVKDMNEEKERIEARMVTLSRVREHTKNVVEDEAISIKRKKMNEEKAIQQATEQEQNLVEVKIDALKAQVDKKRKSDEAVIAQMRKAIRKQEQDIANLHEKIALRIKKIEDEQRLQSESIEKRPSQSLKKLEHDSKASLQASIAKLKEYIQANAHYLQ